MQSMEQLIQESKGIKPVIEVNGVPLYTTQAAQSLNKKALAEEKLNPGRVDIGERRMNPDGTYASSRRGNTIIDPEIYFDNRYRKVGSKYEIVTDFRALTDQASGKIYTNNIPVHVISKGPGGKLRREAIKIIPASEFVREFKRKLKVEAMISIWDLIGAPKQEIDADDLEL